MRKIKIHSALLLAALAVAAAPASADTRSGSYAFSYGNSSIGGGIDVYGSMTNATTSSKSYGRLSGTVRLFGASREAGRVEATGEQSYGSGTGSLTVRIGGMTVWTQSLSYSGSRSYSTILNAFPSDPTTVVWVGPVPVTTSGNVGVGAGLDLQWTLVASTLSAGISGSARAWGVGTANAAVGVPGYGVGVRLTLNFASHQVNCGMNASRNGLSGYLGYSLNPINLLLDLVVNFWPWSWTTNLVTYSWPPYAISNLLQ